MGGGGEGEGGRAGGEGGEGGDGGGGDGDGGSGVRAEVRPHSEAVLRTTDPRKAVPFKPSVPYT